MCIYNVILSLFNAAALFCNCNYLMYLNKPDFLFPYFPYFPFFFFFLSHSLSSHSNLPFFLYFSSLFDIFRLFFPFIYLAFSPFWFNIFPSPISTLIIISHPSLTSYLLFTISDIWIIHFILGKFWRKCFPLKWNWKCFIYNLTVQYCLHE